jgi:DNA-binding NarL/FixJ family response regulator
MDKLKVFISDDSATIRERLVTMTLDLPEIAVVGQAQDAPGSLDAIRQTRPDVVILDIRMPGGNGLKVLRRLKKMTPAPKVIMLTNFAYVQYREKCEEAGADLFLDKSTEFDKLPQALEQVRQDLRAEAGAGGSSQSHGAPVHSTLSPAEQVDVPYQT